MGFVGNYLKQKRIDKKISLSKVCKDLNLSKELIEDIENDKIPPYLNKVFLIGHVRSLAKYLDLDAENLIKNYKIQNPTDNKNHNQYISKPVFNRGIINFNKSISLVSIVLITSIFYFLFIETNDFYPEYAMTSDIPENLSSSIEEIEMEIILKKKYADNKISDLLDEERKLINENVLSSSAVASLPNKNEINQNDKNITLKFLNPTWIQIRNEKDEIVFSKLMSKDDEYYYKVSNRFLLTAGNAGNIVVLIDNKVTGKLGKFGEVIESLVIDTNFNN